MIASIRIFNNNHKIKLAGRYGFMEYKSKKDTNCNSSKKNLKIKIIIMTIILKTEHYN